MKFWCLQICPLITKQLTKGREEGSKITEIETTSFMNGPKKECQTTHHPECKKIPHTVYVEKCDVNTEQKCETVYESVQDENCNTVYDTKCHTSYDAPLYRNSKVNLHPFKSQYHLASHVCLEFGFAFYP